MTPTSAFQWIATVASVALVLWAGWWLRGCTVPEPEVPPTEVVYVDREITKRDTVTVDRPVTRTIYQRTTDTVYVKIPVPTDFQPYGVISSSPVRVRGNEFTLSYWSPDSTRWIQDTFTADEQRWGVNMTTGLECGPLECAFDTRISGRYRRVTGYVGLAVGQISRGPIWGVRVRIW